MRGMMQRMDSIKNNFYKQHSKADKKSKKHERRLDDGCVRSTEYIWSALMSYGKDSATGITLFDII